MSDRVTAAKRSEIMRAVKSKDTGPELALRKLVHGLGYRYRLHRKDLPGKPDLVFPGRRKIIFVHGCFWHGHNCQYGQLPKSKIDYWRPKIAANRIRDGKIVRELHRRGWTVLTVWQCQLKHKEHITQEVASFLGPQGGRTNHRELIASSRSGSKSDRKG